MRRRALSNTVVLTLFAALCVGGLGYLAVGMGLQLPAVGQGWRLEASFAGTDGLVAQADVAVSGVKVGKVLSVAPDGQGGSEVVMRIEDGVRLRRDVRAILRPKSLIGEKYVELVRNPGSTQPYVSDGYRIGRSRTGQSVSVDDVLNAMDPQTRAAFSESLRQLGVALDGRQGDLNASLPQVEQTAQNLRPLAQIADHRQQQIDRILTDLAIIMTALSDEQDALGRIITSGDATMSAVADRDQQLKGALHQANTLFISLDTTFAGLTPADRSSLQQGPPTIATGRTLLSELNPAVDRLLPELLLAQVNYPNNQLSVSGPNAISLAYEWLSAFSQNDLGGHSFRVTGIPGPTGGAALPAGAPVPATIPPGTAAPASGSVPPVAQLLLGLPR